VKFYKTYGLFLLVLLIAGFSCSPEENNPLDPGSDPVISTVRIQNKWNNLKAEAYKIEVSVSDPQGIRSIKRVEINFVKDQNQEVVLEASLYDDGGFNHSEDGDVLAGDGVFSNCFMADKISTLPEEHQFTINIAAFDDDAHQSPQISYPLIIGANQPPKIKHINAPDSLSALNPEFIFSITVSDSNGTDDVVEAFFESENLARGYTKFEQYLYNDGDIENHGDALAGDSVFSAIITPDFSENKSGQFNLRFFARDSYGETNENISSQVIYIGNLPPAIENITMPDTLHIPRGTGPSDYNYKPIAVQVSDPEGLSSIDSVYFYSRKPEGELANNGLPFVMVDNGQPFNINDWFVYENYGDLRANDGIYAYPLVVRYDFDPGVYTFMFYVRDKAGNLIGPVNKNIELISLIGQGD
jgi:hypothetical protein